MAANYASNDAFNHTVPLLINGEEISTENTFDVISPVTHHKIWYSSSASPQDAIRAVEAAQAALPAWAATKPNQRRDILLKAASILESRKEECAEYMKIETGSGDWFSHNFNLPVGVELLRDVAGRIATVTGSTPTSALPNRSALVLKEPYGVVLGIAPWNAPYILGLRAIAYGLAAGNTCILKGSELSPRCFWAIGSLFQAAGLPPGVLNVLFHRPEDAAEVTSTLIAHPSIKKINFTGSTATGAIIAEQAGKHLKPVLLELGGKAPAIILADANIQQAAESCAAGAFLHTGQICMSTERILVHESIMKAFSDALSAAMETQYPSSAPAEMLVRATSVEKNKSLITDALSKGATLISGSLNTEEPSPTRLRPIIISHITPSMSIYDTESFGPTVSLLPFATEDEAIRIANDTQYGLSSAIFTEDLRAGLRVARRVESGAVHINNMTVHDEAGLPHGGVKKSGFGRFNGSVGIEEFLRTKTVTWAD